MRKSSCIITLCKTPYIISEINACMRLFMYIFFCGSQYNTHTSRWRKRSFLRYTYKIYTPIVCVSKVKESFFLTLKYTVTIKNSRAMNNYMMQAYFCNNQIMVLLFVLAILLCPLQPTSLCSFATSKGLPYSCDYYPRGTAYRLKTAAVALHRQMQGYAWVCPLVAQHLAMQGKALRADPSVAQHL